MMESGEDRYRSDATDPSASAGTLAHPYPMTNVIATVLSAPSGT
jgi:hypothetical protein